MSLSQPGRPGPSDPAFWEGTLLKCVGCRCRFPFDPRLHPFRYEPQPGAERTVPQTCCPQCNQPVRIT